MLGGKNTTILKNKKTATLTYTNCFKFGKCFSVSQRKRLSSCGTAAKFVFCCLN